MTFRAVVRIALYAVALYSILWRIPAYSQQYCGVAEHAEGLPCQTFEILQAKASEAQHHIEQFAQPFVDRVNEHPWTLKAVKSYSDTPIPALLTRAQVWVETEGKPRLSTTMSHASAIAWDLSRKGFTVSKYWAKRSCVLARAWAKRGYVASHDLATRGCAAGRLWAKNKALPFAKKQWCSFKVHAVRLATYVRARIETSKFYNDWILVQYHRIVQGPKPNLSSAAQVEASAGSTAGSETPEPTSSAAEQHTQEPAYATPPSASKDDVPESVAAAPSDTADAHQVQSSEKRESPNEPVRDNAEPSKVSQRVSTPEKEQPAAPAPAVGGPAESAEAPMSAADEPAVPEPIEHDLDSQEAAPPVVRGPRKSWLKRLSRTVEGAISSMDDDAEELAMRDVKTAKPEIMGMLREINKYGDAAVKESTALAEELESRSRRSRKTTSEDVYPGFEAASREMAEMALKVRKRAEELANKVLEGLVSVRKVTLDALDDYFDVVLVEAAKQISDDNNEVEAWKEYSLLKQKMREYRKRVEDHEFNMDEVNVALRESQMAAVVLVQDFNKQLIEQRARCQIVLQEREPQPEPNSEFIETFVVEDETAQEEQVEPTEDEPEEGKATQERSADSNMAMHARPAAHVVDQVVELEESEPVELPFDSELEFEDSNVIETHWETRQVYQTVTE